MYRNLKFLHMTDFFSTDTVLVSVTNMRYGKYVNVNVFIWNFSTDPPTQKMKHMFHMIILCCTFHKTQKDDDGGDGDII